MVNANTLLEELGNLSLYFGKYETRICKHFLVQAGGWSIRQWAITDKGLSITFVKNQQVLVHNFSGRDLRDLIKTLNEIEGVK